jgi:hypothetical protein
MLFRRRDPADVASSVLLAAAAAGLLAVVWEMVTRPFFYNEQWRAWHVVLPEMPWRVSEGTDAPIAFGYAAVTKLSGALLGGGEVALRLPSLVSLPILGVLTYRLCRRWTGAVAALLAALALLGSRMTLTFGAELAPYTVEAACVAGALLLWFGAQDRRWCSPLERWARYAGIAALLLLATPLALVMAPLFVVDVVRAVRHRSPSWALPAVAAGLAGLVHLVAYVNIQTSQVHGPYWQDTFLRGDSLLADLWRGLATWVPNALTGGTGHFPNVPDGEVPFPSWARAALAVLMVVALLAGVVAAARDREARWLVVALGGCLVAQAAASLAHRWPFTFTRVNTFLLPVAYVLVATGMSRAGRFLRRRPAPLRATALAAGLAAYGLVLAVGYRQVATVEAEGRRPAYGTGLPRLVEQVRLRAGSGDVVVLHHEMTTKGWELYMARAGAGPTVPRGRTVTLHSSEVDVLPLLRFLDAHPDAPRVYVVGLTGTHREPVRAVQQVLRQRGYHETAAWYAEATGRVREFSRS